MAPAGANRAPARTNLWPHPAQRTGTDRQRPRRRGRRWKHPRSGTIAARGRAALRRPRHRRPGRGPRGDRRPQRLPRARRRHRHEHVPHRVAPPATPCARPPAATPAPTWPPALAALSRGALLGARGNSRRDPQPDARGALPPDRRSRGPDERNAPVVADALQRATRRELRRGRRRRSRAPSSPSPAPRPSAADARGRRAERPGPRRVRRRGRGGPRGAGPHPRPAAGPPRRRRGRRRRPRAERDPRRRRDRAHRPAPDARSRTPIGTPCRSRRRRRAGRRPRRGRPGLRGDVPPRRRGRPRSRRCKQALAPLGDSLVVVGGEGLWNVHVHVDDVGAAIEAGIEAGRPHRVRVTHFAEQVRARAAPARRPSGRGRRIVAVAAGPGLAALFAEAGAVVVEGGPGRRPSTGQLLEAITACGAAEVVVLPNDPDSVRVAQIAARTAEEDEGVRVAVIPTQAQVQGLAALAVHEPGRAASTQDVLEMTATARHARHGAVTVAARRAITMAGPCEPGDVLGVIEGDFAVVGDDLLRGRHRRPRPAARRRRRAGHARRRRGRRRRPGRGAAQRLRRGAPRPCRRRGVRRWPGALPAAHVRGVSPERHDHPRLPRRHACSATTKPSARRSPRASACAPSATC